MGCGDPNGGVSPVGWDVIPQIATGVVQYLIMDRMLDAAKEAREKMELLAEEMLLMAEELHANHMALREYDEQVYDHLKALPSYDICQTNIERGELSGKLLAGQLIKQNAFGHSWYNVGSRMSAIQDAINASIISTGEQSVEAYNFEETTKDAYDSLKVQFISAAGAFEGRIDGVFGQVAQSYTKQADLFNQSANGSVAAFAYSVSGLLNTANKAIKQSKARDTAEFRQLNQAESQSVSSYLSPSNSINDFAINGEAFSNNNGVF